MDKRNWFSYYYYYWPFVARLNKKNLARKRITEESKAINKIGLYWTRQPHS